MDLSLQKGLSYQLPDAITRFSHLLSDPKPFKSSASIFDGVRKRPSLGYSSFGAFPGKKPVVYFDKPGLKYFKPINYLSEYKYPKYIDNEIGQYYYPFAGKGHDERCPLHKVSFKQDLYFQVSGPFGRFLTK